jgi:hypothetical protein
MVRTDTPPAEPRGGQQGSDMPPPPKDLDQLARDLDKKITEHLGRKKKKT